MSSPSESRSAARRATPSRLIEPIGVVLFRATLLGIAALMVLASRVHPRIRRQLTRDLTFEISSDDGVTQYLVIDARSRTISAPRRPPGAPEVVLRFATAWEGLTALLCTDTAGRIVRGMNTGGTRVTGNAVLVLWLHGLTRVVAPIGRTRYPRRPIPAPLRVPETQADYSRWLTHEPAVSELDRAWSAGWRGRERLLMLRVANGERLPPG